MSVELHRLEAVLDASGIAPRIEDRLAVGVRPRQLGVRTLLVGMLVCQAEGRAAHLTRVHRSLCALDEPDRRRLGVVVDWRCGPHELSYRQVERTFSLVVAALAKGEPDGAPSRVLQELADAVVEASVEEPHKAAATSLAVDWTDVESFSTRRKKPGGAYADHEADWGHRKGGGPGEKDERFFGYYLSLATMVKDDDGTGDDVAELVRRMQLVGCDHDPVPGMVDVVVAMPKAGIPLGDVVADSGYAHRVPVTFALPLRAAGAQLVMDLHPSDRSTQGTHQGAVVHHGNLYCPMTPPGLFGQAPLPRGASREEATAHDTASEELARYKLGRVSGADGYHRVMCPALMGKVRCPLREGSMALALSRPEVLSVPEHPPTCCTQQTVTVPPSVGAKTAQRHDYPSKAWRRSYARRSAAERSNSRIKDPATIDIARGWCRTMGLVPMTLFLVAALVVHNLAVADAFVARQDDDRRRAADGRPPRTSRRRRTTLTQLAGASPGGSP